jgi:hypothetical protein
MHNIKVIYKVSWDIKKPDRTPVPKEKNNSQITVNSECRKG